MENWTLGGDMDTMSGGAGAEIFLALDVGGNGLLGERGELTGEDMEDALGLRRRAGLGAVLRPGTMSPSSGNGPSMEPPLALLTPDMALTLCLSSAPLLAIREFWIAA